MELGSRLTGVGLEPNKMPVARLASTLGWERESWFRKQYHPSLDPTRCVKRLPSQSCQCCRRDHGPTAPRSSPRPTPPAERHSPAPGFQCTRSDFILSVLVVPICHPVGIVFHFCFRFRVCRGRFLKQLGREREVRAGGAPPPPFLVFLPGPGGLGC